MTYLDLIRDAEYKLEHNKINLGEYNKMIEPLRAEIPKAGRLTGTWKAHEDKKIPGYWHYGCSVCGCEVEKARNYCPNCGARLEGFES